MATRNSVLNILQLIIYVAGGTGIASVIYQDTVINDVGIEFIEKEKNASQVVLNENTSGISCGRYSSIFDYTAVENDNNSPIKGNLCCTYLFFSFTPRCDFLNF